MKNLDLDKKQKKLYKERAKKNQERLKGLKEDVIESRNFGNICRRLKAWHYDGDKEVTLTPAMIAAIKNYDMEIFKSQFTPTMLKKWDEVTETYGQFYFGNVEDENSTYITQIRIDDVEDEGELLEKKQKECASKKASMLKSIGIDVDAETLQEKIDLVIKPKDYKRQYNMQEVFNVLAKIDQAFFALYTGTGTKPTPKTLKFALNLSVTDRDLEEHEKAVA